MRSIEVDILQRRSAQTRDGILSLTAILPANTVSIEEGHRYTTSTTVIGSTPAALPHILGEPASFPTSVKVIGSSSLLVIRGN
jgi:hypothetical protein